MEQLTYEDVVRISGKLDFVAKLLDQKEQLDKEIEILLENDRKMSDSIRRNIENHTY